MKKKLVVVAAVLGVVVVFLGVLAYNALWHMNYYVVERNEYREPERDDELKLFDDSLEDKTPAFDPDLVDSRSIGDWELNASAPNSRSTA